jgi:hypothetical protein
MLQRADERLMDSHTERTETGLTSVRPLLKMSCASRNAAHRRPPRSIYVHELVRKNRLGDPRNVRQRFRIVLHPKIIIVRGHLIPVRGLRIHDFARLARRGTAPSPARSSL